MDFIKNFYQFLLENKKQSYSVLKKVGLDPSHEDYIKLTDWCEKIFNSLNYLGLLTIYRFEQDTSMDELKDLLPWLKENSGRLSKSVLEYKKFEDLKDEIIKIDNKQKVKVIYDLLPREQKDLTKKVKEQFFGWAIEIHSIKMFKEFGAKISRAKTSKELIEYMQMFVEENSEAITYDIVLDSIRKVKDAEIIFQDADRGWILAEIKSYEASHDLGTSAWCISTGRGSWNNYVGNTRQQFFFWDFTLNRSETLFKIGFTTNIVGQIIHVHDKNDAGLIKNIPGKVKELFKLIDFSFDPLEYRAKIDKAIEDGHGNLIDNELNNRDVYLISVDNREDLSFFEPETWNSIFPWDRKVEFNFYVIIDFNKPLSDPHFTVGIKAKSYEDVEKSEVIDMFGSTTQPTEHINMFIKSGKIEYKRLDEYYDEIQKEYSEHIRNVVTNENISKRIVKTDSKNIWIFKIVEGGYNPSIDDVIKELGPHAWKFSKWRPFEHMSNVKPWNCYMLINLKKTALDDELVMGVTISDEKITIKFNNESKPGDITGGELPKLLQKSIDNGIIIPKTMKKYYNQIEELRVEFWEKVNDLYENEKVNLKAKVLYDFLVNNYKLDADEEYDNNSNTSEEYQKILIPNFQYYGHYGLKSYDIYNSSLYLGGSFFNDEEWSIGTEDEADSAAYKQAEDYIEENGYAFNDNSLLLNNIKGERFANDYVDSIDYFEEMIREDPESWGVEKDMTDEAKVKLASLNKELEELGDQEERKKEIEEELEELKDKDIEDYWELDDEKVTLKAETEREFRKKEAANDPVGYLQEFGYEEKEIGEKLGEYADDDAIIKDIISIDGRGPGLSYVDGKEYEHTYNGIDYYIYQTR